MTDLNTVVLIGNIVRDVELSYSPNGTAITKGSIAVNRSRKSGDQWIDETSYFDFTVFGKMGESLKPMLTKGKKVAIHGWLKQDRWHDKDDKEGATHTKISVNVSDLQLLTPKEKQNYSYGADNAFIGYGC